MRMYDIIQKKRNDYPLNEEEIGFVVKGFTDGVIPDYQMSAFLMTVTLNGMTPREILSLTKNMAFSGDMIDLSHFGDITADKHSTGGVGDKTTLIVAPLAASMGCRVAKISGRGLGHTGGTVDKLESISGFKTELSPAEFMNQVESIGIAVVAQSGNVVPADKKIYALRDETATVDSIPLIASSIMSKKIASGSHNIVIDVKVGNGAFMKTARQAQKLAREMIRIGTSTGRNVSAVLTNMDVPLGRAVGNSLEVIEAVEVLKGRGDPELERLSVQLAAIMYSMATGKSLAESTAIAKSALDSGKALAKLSEWVLAQGGDPKFIYDYSLLGESEKIYRITAPASGFVSAINAELIGKAAMLLGAGREKAGDKIDYTAGIVIQRKIGEPIGEGEELAQLHYSDYSRLKEAEEIVRSAFRISELCPPPQKLIYAVVK